MGRRTRLVDRRTVVWSRELAPSLTVVVIDKLVMDKALELADGDRSRLVLDPAGSVTVLNYPTGKAAR